VEDPTPVVQKIYEEGNTGPYKNNAKFYCKNTPINTNEAITGKKRKNFI